MLKNNGYKENIQWNVIKLYEQFIFEKFHRPLSELNVIVFGLEMQVMGGLLKYIPDLKLMNPELKYAGRFFFGKKSYLPEMLTPYNKNTVIIVSKLYAYEYEKVCEELQKYGIPTENIAHGRTLAESILKIAGQYFAQGKMDLYVKSLFDRIKKSISDIKYIDIGANNYMLYNNTYLFYKAGASGVLVEANPDFYDIQHTNRPRDIVLNCGCAPDEYNKTMIYYKTTRAGYNTFIYSDIKEKIDIGEVKLVEEIDIPMRSITNIIKENFPDKHIDYLSIDVEFMATPIINSIDLTDIIIDVILIEMHPDTLESRNLYLKLNKLGYEMEYKNIGLGYDFLFYNKKLFQK